MVSIDQTWIVYKSNTLTCILTTFFFIYSFTTFEVSPLNFIIIHFFFSLFTAKNDLGVSSLTWILSFSFRYCEESNSLISDAIGVAFPVSSFSSFLSIFPVPFDHFRILRFLACLPTMLFCYWISNCPCKYKLINSTIYVFFL